MATHRKPDTGAVSSKSPAHRITGVDDGESVEIHRVVFKEYESPIGFDLARETLGGAR